MSEPVETSGPHTFPDPLSEPLPVVQEPVAVPEQQQHLLKRWTFLLVLVAVWIPAAAIGLGLYYWWFHSVDKTWPVFVVLNFVVVCAVAAILAAMVDGKPVVAAVAIALMSAPLAAVLAAAVLHGTYYSDRVSRCLVGLIPY